MWRTSVSREDDGGSAGRDARRIDGNGEDFERQSNGVVDPEVLHGRRSKEPALARNVPEDGEVRVDRRRVVDRKGEVDRRVGRLLDLDVVERTPAEPDCRRGRVERRRFDLLKVDAKDCKGASVQVKEHRAGAGERTVGVDDADLRWESQASAADWRTPARRESKRTFNPKLSRNPFVCTSTSLPVRGASIPLKVTSGGLTQTAPRCQLACPSPPKLEILTEERSDNAHEDDEDEDDGAAAHPAAATSLAALHQRSSVLVAPPHPQSLLFWDLPFRRHLSRASALSLPSSSRAAVLTCAAILPLVTVLAPPSNECFSPPSFIPLLGG